MRRRGARLRAVTDRSLASSEHRSAPMGGRWGSGRGPVVSTAAKRETAGFTGGVRHTRFMDNDTQAGRASPDADRAAADVAEAGLWLAAARVEDFRVLSDVHVELDHDLTVLVGENNAGKTALLLALERALQRSRAGEDELRVRGDGSRADRFLVDLRFEPASPDGFSQPLRDVLGQAVRPPQPPRVPSEFAALRTEGTVGAGGELRYRQRFLQGWATDREEAQDVSELANVPVSPQFLRLLEFSLLDAARDLQQDRQRRTSPWGQLLAELDIPEDVQREIEESLGHLSDDVLQHSPVLQRLRSTLRRLESALPAGVA